MRYVDTIVKKALKDAIRWGMLVRSVADPATPPRSRDYKGAEMKAWNPEEAARFLDRTRGNRQHPLWSLAVAAGMRRGELVGLRWSDVDLEAGRLPVRRAVVTVRYEVIESGPKTEKESASHSPRSTNRRHPRGVASATT